MTGCKTTPIIMTYQALYISARSRREVVQLDAVNPALTIKTKLGARRLKREQLCAGIDMWRDPEAVIGEKPILNPLAMWVMQHLLNPIEVKVIYGDVICTGRGPDDKIIALQDEPLKTFREALELP